MVRNKDVAEDFARGLHDSKTANLFIEGRAIYSYGHHFPIALRLIDGTALFNKDGYSSTTSRHKGLVARALQGRYKLEFVDTKTLVNAISRDISSLKELIIEKV